MNRPAQGCSETIAGLFCMSILNDVLTPNRIKHFRKKNVLDVLDVLDFLGILDLLDLLDLAKVCSEKISLIELHCRNG